MERLLKYFVPEKYVLDLDIDKHKKTILGEVTVFGTAKAENIKFHAVDLSIDNVSVNGEDVDFSVEDGLLTLQKVPRSDLEVKIGYHGSLNENMQGAYLSSYEYEGKKEIIVATQFESHYAREAFPCIDEPEAKAVFSVSIGVPDEEDMILSNMPAEDESENAPFEGFRRLRPRMRARAPRRRARATRPENGRVLDSSLERHTVSFQPTPRMSTYLLAFVIGKFHGKTVKNEHGTTITTYCALNQDIDSVDFANEIAMKSLEFYDDNFGEPYPLEKLDQVALPDFEAGAMENWGLVTYRESMLLALKDATLATKKSVALTVAHELSHQWFGDLVTMAWWDDLWLNESFASVMEYFAVDHIHPEYKIFEGFFTGDALLALRRDAYSDVQAVHQDISEPVEISTLFDSAIVYSKGARLILMLIRTMGWEAFSKGISDYFKKFKYQNTVGDDLWAALEPYADFSPKELIHSFIDKPGYPVITDGKQKRFLIDGEMKEESWPIPKVTEDMSGHYILNLTEAEFKERLDRYDELSLEEKLRLLIDRYLLSRTSLVSSVSLLPLLKKFKNEDKAAIYNIILSIVGNLKIFFPFQSEEEKSFKKFVGSLVKDKLEKIGLETRENDDENTIRLRAILLALDYFAEDEENLGKLSAKFTRDYEAIDKEVRNDILSARVYFEPETIYDLISDYQKVSEPELKFDLLLAATLVRTEKEIDELISLLKKPDIVKPQDHFYLFIYLYRNEWAREKVFSWLKENWEYVEEISADKSIDNYPRYMANSIRTEEEYKEYCEFFEPKQDNLVLSRTIKIGKKEIKARLALIKADQKDVWSGLGDLNS